MGDRQTIRISCNTRDFLPFSQIKEISKIITSIKPFRDGGLHA